MALLLCSLLLAAVVQQPNDALAAKGGGRGKPVRTVDTTPPSITAPADVVAVASGTLTKVNLGQPAVSDNTDSSPAITNNAPTNGFPLGTSTVVWTATDSSGNKATANQKVTIVADTTAPSVSVSQPSGYPSVERGSSITLQGTASDSQGVNIVEARLGSAPYVQASGTNSWTVDVPVAVDFTLGGNTITIRATDNNGNMGYASKNLEITDTPQTSPPPTNTTSGSKYHYDPWFVATGSNYYDIPDNAALRLQKFSLAAWFNTTMSGPSPSAIIAGKGGFGSESAGQNMNYGIWMDPNNVIVAGFEDASGGNAFVGSQQTFNDGKWHYVVVTFDGNILRLFIDGQSAGSATSALVPDHIGTEPLRIGGNSIVDDRHFQGLIDEVRVWNRSLTSNEVSAQYSDGTFDTSGLLAYMYGNSYDTYYGSGTQNNAPLADAGQDKTVLKNSIVTLDGSGSYDPDGNPLTFKWTQTSGPAVTLSNSGASKPTFVAPDVAFGTTIVLTFSLLVDDGTTTDSDSVSITDMDQDSISPTGSVKINSGAQYTTSTAVTLALTCSDSESGCSQMRISSDGTLDTESFEAYSASKATTLPSGNGMKTVKVELKDGSGNVSPVYSTSITLDSTDPNAPVITSPASGTTTTNKKPTFGGTSEASASISVYYLSGTSTVAIGTAKASSTGTWSVTPLSDMATATYNVQAKATDAAGNISPASSIVKVTISTTTTVTIPSTGYTYTYCASGCTYNNLQTAINALPSTGGSILIKDGHYTWSSTITLKSGTRLTFSSGAYVTFTGNTRNVLSGNGVHDVSINGGSITALYTGVKVAAFYSSSGINVTGIKAVLVQGSNSNGFYCQDCIDAYVSNMNIKSATRGIDIKTSVRDASSGLTRNVWLENNVIDDTSVEGIKVNWCKDVHIISNKVSNTANNGIDIGFNINSEVIGNNIYRTGLDGEGIHTDSTNTALVKDNYVDSTTSTGITVYRAMHVDVIGNTVVNAGKNGINIIDTTQPSSYVTIKSNIVKSAALDGIYQSPSQVQVEIAYNTVSEVASGYQGIRVIWSNNPTTTVHDNTVI